jgi:hypothetical protein
MSAPINDVSSLNSSSVALPQSSIVIVNAASNAATPTLNQPPAVTLADAMSGTTATASITILGQNSTAQSSGSTIFIGVPSVALPIAIVSSILLM